MDKNLKRCTDLHVEKTLSNLKKNNMEAYYVESKEEAISLIESLINEGDTIAFGGSTTLREIGFFDLVKNGKYNLLDRDKEGLTREQAQDINRQAFLSDAYFASANAITEHGEIYEVDGNGNRVAAITFGPKNVFIVAGYNKIVKNMRDAVERVKNTACPANTMRLNIGTQCNSTGTCVNGGKCDERNLMAVNAGSCPNSICSFSSVISHQTNVNRIKVIIIEENLGF
jgi:L-lactate utilization protein LutB